MAKPEKVFGKPRCPKCRKGVVIIRDTRGASETRYLVRRRCICTKCDHRFWTIEAEMPESERIGDSLLLLLSEAEQQTIRQGVVTLLAILDRAESPKKTHRSHTGDQHT